MDRRRMIAVVAVIAVTGGAALAWAWREGDSSAPSASAGFTARGPNASSRYELDGRFGSASVAHPARGVHDAAAMAGPPGYSFRQHKIPTPSSEPSSLAVDARGNVWFTEAAADKIGRLSPAGDFAEFPLAEGARPAALAVGGDGRVWFTEMGRDRIGAISQAGDIEELVLARGATPLGIAASPTHVWFTESGSNSVGRSDLRGNVTQFGVPTIEGHPTNIAVARDGSAWFLESYAGKLGHVSVEGHVSEVALDTNQSGGGFAGLAVTPDGVVWVGTASGLVVSHRAGGDFHNHVIPSRHGVASLVSDATGNVWFTEAGGNVGAVRTDGSVIEYRLPFAQTGPLRDAAGIAVGDSVVWFSEIEEQASLVALTGA